MTPTRFLTAAGLVAGLTLSFGAFAQSVMSYYIVQDVKTKKCTIVDAKPAATTTEYKIVGADGVVYKTRTEAENVMKTEKVCTTE